MNLRLLSTLTIILSIGMLLLLSACTRQPVEVEVSVRVILSGKPVLGARVSINGHNAGTTDLDGRVRVRTEGMPGQRMTVDAVLDTPGLKSKPWQGELVLRQDEQESGGQYDIEVVLQGYVLIVAQSGETSLTGAEILSGEELLGSTGSDGAFEYVYESWPEQGLELTVRKKGYVSKTISVGQEVGNRLEVKLYERAVISLQALSRRGGAEQPLAGVKVWLGDKLIGKTDKDGQLIYHHEGKHGGKAEIRMKAPGHVPSSVSRQLTLEGRQALTRYFFPTDWFAQRLGIHDFAANSAGDNMAAVLKKIQAEFERRLFEETDSFAKVPAERLKMLIKDSRLGLERMTSRGWVGRDIHRELDVLVTGSVSSNGDGGYLIDISFYSAAGEKLSSHVAESGSDGNWRIGRALARIVDDISERYPFEGLITSVEGKHAVVNMGTRHYPLGRKDRFALRKPVRDERGLPVEEKEVGILVMEKRNKKSSVLVMDRSRQGAEAEVGDRVVRLEPERRRQDGSAVIEVTGGVGDSRTPLSGVNVYVNRDWIGVTALDGKITIPVRVGRDADLILYRHGFRQVTKEIDVEKENQSFSFSMESLVSGLRLSSTPAGANVYIDELNIGKTPIRESYPVPLGFHTVRVSAGGVYRDWEEVVEFNDREENFTGNKKIHLQRDHLRQARRAMRKGDINKAIRELGKAAPEHPDYAEARHRLALIYLDDKGDYEAAIAELEKVTAIPEVRDLVYKQFSVVYTNLGHAYFARGDSLIRKQPKQAVDYFARAVKSLDKARENMRFFPSKEYDQIAHDTYYYTAVSLHNIYAITGDAEVRDSAELAWEQYFDFFPKGLEGRKEYNLIRDAAEKLWRQLRDGS